GRGYEVARRKDVEPSKTRQERREVEVQCCIVRGRAPRRMGTNDDGGGSERASARALRPPLRAFLGKPVVESSVASVEPREQLSGGNRIRAHDLDIGSEFQAIALDVQNPC